MADKFDDAVYYDARKCESLTCESAAEALEVLVDNASIIGQPILEVIASVSPAVVVAYDRDSVEPDWIVSQARLAAERVAEEFSEDFGDPDGGGDEVDQAALAEALLPVIREHITNAHVWRCSEVAQRTYDAEEVEAILRQHCPIWFETLP